MSLGSTVNLPEPPRKSVFFRHPEPSAAASLRRRSTIKLMYGPGIASPGLARLRYIVHTWIMVSLYIHHSTTPYTRATSFSETSRAAGYSHLGSVLWVGQGSVGFTPGAGRGSGRAVVRQCAGRAVRQGRAGQLGS